MSNVVSPSVWAGVATHGGSFLRRIGPLNDGLGLALRHPLIRDVPIPP